jgi:homoserine dehydrogenase
VLRDGLGAEAMRQAQAALLPGQTLKQVAEAERSGDTVTARVRLEALPPGDVLAHLSGMEAGLTLHTDTMGDLTIIEGEGGPGQTAHGVMADLVAVAHQIA